MELSEIKSMWQAQDKKLDNTLRLNLRFLEMIQSQKLRSKLTPVFWQRIIELAFHSVAVVLLMGFLFYNISQFPYAASAGLLIGFYTVGILNCVKQIRVINGMDYSNDIVTIQSTLLMLQTNNLNNSRMMILCMPTFLAYPVVVSKAVSDLKITFVKFDIMASSNGNWWTAQLVSSIILIPLCIWLYQQLTYKNIHKPWVKDFIQVTSGVRVRKAIESIKELESLKKDFS